MQAILNKKTIKRAALAALVAGMTASSANADNSAAVGDLPGYDVDGYFATSEPALDQADKEAGVNETRAEAVPDESVRQTSGYVGDEVQGVAGDLPASSYPAGQPMPMAGTVNQSYASPGYASQGYVVSGGSMSSTPCDSGCGDGGCSAGDCGCGDIAASCDPRGTQFWLSGESLLWFADGRNQPALVSTAAEGIPPITQLGDVDVAYGNELESGLLPGFRVDGGFYLGDNIGVGGRYWQLFGGEDTFRISGDGTGRSIGRPFYNTSAGLDDALLINFNQDLGPGNQTIFAGNVDIRTDLDVWAAEAYGRIRFSGTKDHALDLIGGYTHAELDDSLSISSVTQTIEDDTFGTPIGTVRTFQDSFRATNEFDGGQVGFESVLTRGRWFARSLTKVHLGVMRSSFTATGSSTRTTPTPTSLTDPDGFFGDGYTGTIDRDEFTFIPEMNFKLGYAVRPNAILTVGYSFLMFDDVALAGSGISAVADSNNFFDGNNSDGGKSLVGEVSDAFYLHGVDVGLTFTF